MELSPAAGRCRKLVGTDFECNSPGDMNFLKLYTRVLRLLGPEARLGWILAIANVALAAAQFAEPVLFGRIIDALVRTQAANAPPDMGVLTPLLGAWVAF